MAVHKNNLPRHSPQQNQKSCIDDSCLFQGLCSCTVAEAVKKGAFSLKQKKRTPLLNFAYLN